MSKIGQLNIELEEQATELGYRSLFEALHDKKNPQEIVDGKLVPKRDYQAEAHQEWLFKKEEILNKIDMLIQDTNFKVYKDVLKEVSQFIIDGEK